MRHSKVSALIHNSAAYPNLNSCSVEVHFQDVVDSANGSSTVVPGTELVITRKSFRNNSSKYMINDKESNFTEVTTLLRERGIDLDHKRFLILQGEVESIAQMKPKADNDNDDGLLEYLEDIIGTSQYKKAIEESLAEVEVLNEDCVQKQDRLKIVETELNSLEDQKNDIVTYLELENELAFKQSALWQLQAYLCQKRVELSKSIVEEQHAKLKAELDRTTVNSEEIEVLKKDHAQKLKELDLIKKTLSEKSKLLSKHEIEKVKVEERKKHLDSKRKKLEKSIEAATHSKVETETWLSNYQEESSQLSDQLKGLQKSLENENCQLEAIQDELKDKTAEFTDQIETIQKKLEPWREKTRSKESEIAVANSELELLKERESQGEKSLNESKENITITMKEGRAKEREMEKLKKELEHVTSQISMGVKECDQASIKLAKMKQQLVNGRQRVDAAKEALSSTTSQNKVLTGLTRLNDSGRIQGFRGRLGALGTIDAKYDVAISTACPSLDNMVVDTVAAGEQCVDYLRKQNLGRAKFILLEKLPKRDLSPIQTPENVPRLFDLIVPSAPEYAPAFYSVLFDTLVAKDADQARRIAYGKKRWRVVTLDGVIVEASGAMSGGGEISRGKMAAGLTEGALSEGQVQELERVQDEHEKKYKIAENTVLTMQTTLKELQERKPEIELEISKVELDITALTARLNEAKKQSAELAKSLEANRPDPSTLKRSEEHVAKLEAELKQLRSHSEGLEQDVADLQEKIMDAGGVRLRVQKSKVDGIKEQIELVNTRLANGLKENAKANNDFKKHSKTIDNCEAEISASTQELEEANKELSEKQLIIQQFEQLVSQLSDQLEEKQEILDELKSELDAKQKDIDSLRSREIEIKNTIDQHEKTIKDESNSLRSWISQLQKLQLHDLSEIKAVRVKKEKPLKKSLPRQDVEEGEEAEGNEEDEDVNEDEDVANKSILNKTELFEYSADELEAMNKAELKREIESLQTKGQNAKVDMQILKDYKRRVEEHDARRLALNESVTARDTVKKMCDDLRNRRLEEFMTGFNSISGKLKEMYQMITMGGNAELELVDSLDPFSEGILFSVMPPKKSWRNISNLSGGEKTLSSLALVFALHHYKPTPLYVMDEIDAALDFRNVSIVATYIKERTKHGQFIVISLRNNMFELAKQLVGIYKVNNMTKSIALQNNDYIHGQDSSNTTILP
ncbi:condensin subunit SMC4 [Sugiyamaella lignohabitans]|uniref:Structural maintenance of chromosomes protein n=1 Tax=Sugiyamaella lignohabitans TaxID=796027 RepID=A0A161HLS3_9ASCO|nr:condensin subunit SMC4 [Sugiyamaella lignohabitans]ANB14397.1 condensin subunit SMC4 [Sugiyamaella lignohabitans]